MITPAEIFKARILIVDDQSANVSLLEQTLRQAGYSSITSTTDPRVVCELHRVNRFDLILLDLQMPGMDGFEVMEGLKVIEPGGYLPVLVLTAQPGHKLRALKAGAKDFVSKPFDLGEVLMRVHNMLEVRLLHLSETIHNYERLENSQRIAGLGDWEYDFASQRLVWSAEVYRILGVPYTDVPPSTEAFQLSVHPDDRSFVHQANAKAVRISNRMDFEYRVIRPGGEVRQIHQISEMTFDDKGMPLRESGTLQDITERKRADEALRENNERYRKLIMLSPDATFVHVNGLITLVNQAFCQLMRAATEDELLGRPVIEVAHPDYREMVRSRQAKRNGAVAVQPEPLAEMKFLRLDHTVVDVEVASVVLVFNGCDEVQVIARDITDRKRLDEHFLQAQKMEALGQFSGGVAHDFNNILGVIMGYSELARMNIQGNPGVRENLGAILKAAGRAVDLVRQILTFSRQEPQQRRIINLQPVVDESIKLLRATLPSTVEIIPAIAADAPSVLADANQIHQILTNLGINAWHALKEQPGTLTLRLEKHEVDALEAAAEPALKAGLYARITVGDTGCGMSAEVVKRIFEPFFTTKPPGEGTGLGLAVVQSIMETHEGAVTVLSQPGKGTEFHLYFPARTGDVAAIALETEAPPLGRGERVLIVDDEEGLAQLGQRTLSALGYEAECVTTPAAALALIRKDPARFALLLTDQTMPGMTGLLFAAQVRAINPALPIVLMTGYNAALTPGRLESAGVRALLIKPVSMLLMATTVRAALSAGAPN